MTYLRVVLLFVACSAGAFGQAGDAGAIKILQFKCSVEVYSPKDAIGSAGGGLRNVSKETLNDVRIRIVWKDAKGRAILQTTARPTTMPLAPGKNSLFNARTRVPQEAKTCEANVTMAR